MAVITISRQLGSGGDEIAEYIGKQLGYRVISRELITQAAQRACTPEIALAEIDELGLLGISPSKKDCKAFIKHLKKTLYKLAEEGDVIIVGRGGQIILHDHPHALHIRIIAPEQFRVSLIRKSQGISAEAAVEQIKASDRYRQKFLKSFFEADLSNPAFYDLLINSANFERDAAAQLIRCALLHKTQPRA